MNTFLEQVALEFRKEFEVTSHWILSVTTPPSGHLVYCQYTSKPLKADIPVEDIIRKFSSRPGLIMQSVLSLPLGVTFLSDLCGREVGKLLPSLHTVISKRPMRS